MIGDRCPRCAGEGQVDDEVCPTCGGTGAIDPGQLSIE